MNTLPPMGTWTTAPGWSVFRIADENWQWSAWSPTGGETGHARTKEDATTRAQAAAARLKGPASA